MGASQETTPNKGNAIWTMLETCFSWIAPSCPDDVSRKERKLDRETTTSFLGRMTFSWADPLLYTANRTGSLGMDDLPQLPGEYSASGLRSAFATAQWAGVRSRRQRFASIVWHLTSKELPVLALMTIICVAVGFVSQAALFGLLRSIEGDRCDSCAWWYALGLCFTLVMSAVIDHRRFWIAFRSLSLRLQIHLLVALFDKAISLDSISGADSPADGKESTTENTQGSENLTNLMAVDVKRVSDFAMDTFLIYETPIRLLISSVALVRLVGWQSLLVSVLTLVLLWPSNNYAMKHYSRAQKTMMEYRDRKIACVTEALHGIRQIKFSATEEQWEEKINTLRAEELEAQRTAFQWNLTLMSFYLLTPTVLSTVMMSVYALLHESLSPATAFTAMSILNTIQNSLNAIPSIISNSSNCIRSAQRLSNYLDTPEHPPSVLPSTGIDFYGATLAWRGHRGINTGVLRDVDLSIPQNCLTLITGPTGGGKSLLLAAMLGECDILRGTVKSPTGQKRNTVVEKDHEWLVEGSVAHVSQSTWIEATTIRDNILFGLPYNAQRYKQVISACALEPDLHHLPDGDWAQLGSNGVNLSGGQKARLCLARALYSRATVLFLDDIFSAVDVHTAAHLCKYALAGPLARGRTRVIVTHHISLCLNDADGIIHVDDGTAHYSGLAKPKRRDSTVRIGTDDSRTDSLSFSSFGSTASRNATIDTNSGENPIYRKGQSSRDNDKTSNKHVVSQKSRKFIDDEGRGKGAVKWGILGDYIQQSGTWVYWLLLVVTFLSYSALMLSRAWWLSLWSQSSESPTYVKRYESTYYAKVYVFLSMMVCIVGATRSYFAMVGSLKASRRLFHRFLHQVLRMPLRWIDTVPVGRVLNRFSNDFNLVDSQLGDDVRAILSYGMDVLMAVVPSLVINPLSLVSSCILGLTTARYANWYLVAAREMKRLDSVVRSPIYDHVESCLAGVWTIRAFGKTQVYQEQFRQHVDRRARTQWYSWLFNQWLAFRLDVIGAIFTATSAAAVVLLGVEASAAGFAINFTLKLTQSISMGIRRYASLELDLGSVERILEYCHMETESGAGNAAPAGWPQNGVLEVRNLAVRYAPDIGSALHNVSFRVARNQRIGIVGRTGAGKSTLALALFRILEPCAGQILIDGVDISTIRLHDIRSRLAIIPQSPVIFKGTLRSNLDPFDKHEDSELISALARVNWDSATTSDNHRRHGDEVIDYQQELADPPSQDYASILDNAVSDGGSNLSHGQRQLLCLARALLRMPRVLILDEATSAVDKTTDNLVQRSIRSEFGRNGTTLLVVAHRLSTVADFDKILVLGGGTMLEFGSPAELMRRENGAFKGMVEKDAEKEMLLRSMLKDEVQC